MQNRRDFLAGIASLTAAITSRSLGVRAASAAERNRAAADATFMYVGSFTSKGRGDGEGLSVYRMDRASGTWTLVFRSREGRAQTAAGRHDAAIQLHWQQQRRRDRRLSIRPVCLRVEPRT